MAALATGTVAALLAVDGGSGGSRAFALESPKPATNPAERALGTGGQLSVIGIPTSGRQQPTAKSDGWYGLSTVGRSGALRYLVRCPGQVRWCGWVESLDWSPNGRWLALSVTSISTPNPYNGIHVVDIVAGVDRQLTRCIPPECDWFDLDWSPDSARIAYVTDNQIKIMGRDGSGSRVVQTGTRGARSSPSWSLDGERIAFANRPVQDGPSFGLRRGLGRSQSDPARSGSGGAGMVARGDDDRARLSLRWDQARDADRQGRHTGAWPPLPRHRRYGRPDLVAGREPDCGRESWVDVDVRASRDLRDGCRRQQPAAAHT